MKAASIYSTAGSMAYQYGNCRALVSPSGAKTYQKLENGVWRVALRQRNLCNEAIAKVKAALGK